MLVRSAGLVWMCLAVAAPACFGQHPIPEAERWATITHPGNEAYVRDPAPGASFGYLGRVDYEYQISRTEVTGSEWLEFVNAYAPFVDPRFANLIMFTSLSIEQTGPQTYSVHPGAVNRGVEMGWWFAARYANWLHNDKALTAEAFENGAYDASTFGYVEGYGYTDQVAHNPDARYWIPTLHEWIKASHFDPNRYGEGQPGYWTYSTSSEDEPIGGPPQIGGQTSAGYNWFASPGYPVPEVAGYRDVQSPWGLWDVSGGVSEWTETPLYSDPPMPGWFLRFFDGSEAGFSDPFNDRIESGSGQRPPEYTIGLRLARAVPGTGSTAMCACALALLIRRRRLDHAAARDPHRICSGTRTPHGSP